MKIITRIFRARKNETLSALMKRVNSFISSKFDEGYSVQKYIVDRELVVVDYWVNR